MFQTFQTQIGCTSAGWQISTVLDSFAIFVKQTERWRRDQRADQKRSFKGGQKKCVPRSLLDEGPLSLKLASGPEVTNIMDIVHIVGRFSVSS